MVLFAVRRVGQTAAMLTVAAVLAFAMANGAGDPVSQIVGGSATAADQAAVRHDLGLDRPLADRAWRYVSAVAVGRFGTSYQFGRPVLALFAERLPATAELAVSSGLLALAIALPVGLFGAFRPRSPWSRLAMTVAGMGVSVPTFMIATFAVAVFSARWHLLPAYGRGEVVTLGFWTTGFLTRSGLLSLVMPAATLAIFQTSTIAKIVRAEASAALASPHVAAAKARGLPASVVRRHVILTMAAPVCSVAGVQFGTVAAFAVVTESVFQWPGMGSLLVSAVRAADVPVLAAYVVMAAALFAAINLTVDVVQMWLDPRVRDAECRR